jgi:hypothetical protein
MSLLTAFSDKGVPDELIVATEIAALRTREPITVIIRCCPIGIQRDRLRAVFLFGHFPPRGRGAGALFRVEAGEVPDAGTSSAGSTFSRQPRIISGVSA